MRSDILHVPTNQSAMPSGTSVPIRVTKDGEATGGRAVVTVGKDFGGISPPQSFSQPHQVMKISQQPDQPVHTSFSATPSTSSLISHHQNKLQHSLPQHNLEELPQQLYDEAEKVEDVLSTQLISLDIAAGSQYTNYVDEYQHANTCERSKHLGGAHRRTASKRRYLQVKGSGENEQHLQKCRNGKHQPQNSSNVFSRRSILCWKRYSSDIERNISRVDMIERRKTESCCHCSTKSATELELEPDNMDLEEYGNTHQYYDYYYVRRYSEDDIDRRLTRRASDFELHKVDQRLNLLHSHHTERNNTKYVKSFQKHPSEDQRLTRSLEELPGDIKEHILQCKCSCDHLGYGNYSTLSLKELPRENWGFSTETSKSGSSNEEKQEPLMKYKQKELEMRYHVAGVICLVLVLAGVAGVGVSVPLALKTTPTPSAAPVEDRLVAAKDLLSETPLVDGHNDLPWNIRKFMHNRLHSFNMTADLSTLRPWSRSSWSHTDIPRLRRGHVGAQFWVSYVPCESQYLNAVQLTIEQIDLIKRLVDQYQNDLRLASSSDDIEEAFREGRIASLIGVEGGHAIQNSLGVLRALHDLGVRYMTLTHTCSTPWAECARNSETDSEDPNSPRGLTHFGKTVVREMNRLGLMVDLSHVSQATMRAALQVSKSPVLFSHSSVYAICRNPRNVPDDILKKVAVNKGLVMVSFYNHFLTCREDATIKDVIDHINHVRNVAGVDHVGIGADFDGVNKLPTGLEDVSKYPNLFAELMNDPTWNEEDLKKLAGLNLLRVLRDVEKVAREHKGQQIGPYEEDVPYSQIKVKDDCTYRFLKDDRS